LGISSHTCIPTYIAKNSLEGKTVALFYTFDSDPKQASEKIREILPSVAIVGELPLKTTQKTRKRPKGKSPIGAAP
jgi:hypothetical protein